MASKKTASTVATWFAQLSQQRAFPQETSANVMPSHEADFKAVGFCGCCICRCRFRRRRRRRSRRRRLGVVVVVAVVFIYHI